MKKSELIKKIMDRYEYDDRPAVFCVEGIIDMAEELGMQPPFVSNGLSGIALQIEGGGSHMWEKENES
jgi:hypothetical protein